uniref:Flavodoxin n=1 Tax=Loigolactobacillus rennini TaxID=238013 RepID=A0A1K2I862_9LACO|nr:Flavodoxin [Loigolactobacillus rennini]
MALAKIVYATMTGNTEGISEILEKAFEDQGLEVDREEADDVDSDFFEDADICVVATYTYDDGELPFDFEDFHDDLEDEDLSGKVFGVAGTGDSELYPDYFCFAADKFEAAFKETGAKKGSDTVKIENEADDDDAKKLQKFAKELVAAAQG